MERYARENRLEWIEDESNADESLTRNFVRRRVGPLLAERFPRWKESLARAAAHFARREAGEAELLRHALAGQGLRAPSAAKLAEMLKQLNSGGSRTLIEHDGSRLRVYRKRILVEGKQADRPYDLEFRPAKGRGLSAQALLAKGWTLRRRRGGERL